MDVKANCPCCGQTVEKPAVLFYADARVAVFGAKAAVIKSGARFKLFCTLYEKWPRVVTWQSLFSTLWPNPADEPEQARGVTRIHISGLRGEIEKIGIRLRGEHGVGYRLEFPAGVATLKPKAKAA